jgi:uncharacterized protein (TIGR02391 family)
MEAWNWMMNYGLLAPKTGEPCRRLDISYPCVRKAADTSRLRDVRTATLLSPKLLHARIVETAWPTFIRCKYDTAVFEAFKEVEVALRTAGGYDAKVIGVSLMRQAFHLDHGPLTDMSLPEAERQSLSDLFAGAIGSHRNAVSPRTVQIDDTSEAGRC